MERLTNKEIKVPNKITMFDNEITRKQKILQNNIYTKLYKLEDLEEELEIKLEDFVYAITNGVYIRHYNKILLTNVFFNDGFFYDLNNYEISCCGEEDGTMTTEIDYKMLSWNDYGKKWAFTESELENE